MADINKSYYTSIRPNLNYIEQLYCRSTVQPVNTTKHLTVAPFWKAVTLPQ